MKREKYTHKKDKAVTGNIVFCSECGDDLELFGLDGSKIDIEKVQERHKNCKEKGRFKGDKCAMIFIAEEQEPSEEDD